MRNAIVVDDDKIPFLPAIEHHVSPHHVSHMLHVLLNNLGPITVHGVETAFGSTADVEEEDFQEEHQK